MSYWERFQLEDLIRQILSNVSHQPNPQHHFGIPYLTTYQLAIEVDRQNPSILEVMDYPIGGAGSARKVSLAQYIARELSARISRRDINDIEGAFLSNIHEAMLSYKYHGGDDITSSLTGTEYDLSMFRMIRPL